MATHDMAEARDLYVAALLHDIGDAIVLGRGMEPDADHAKLGAQYIETVIPGAPAARTIEAHHSPDTRAEMILAVADKLASGVRGKRVQPGPLVSVFSRISIDTRPRPAPYYVPPIVYSPDVPAYPDPDEGCATDHGRRFASHWERFDGELCAALRNIDSERGQERLLYVLQKYTITLPALEMRRERAVSLYDHLKTTAAIASAIAAANPADDDLRSVLAFLEGHAECAAAANQEDLLLVGGDISGIQPFIYEIPNDMAAKNLRGRSFLLGYLMKVVAESILRDLGLPLANALLVGGGRFTLLLPRSAETLIDDYQRRLDDAMFDAFGGKIAILLAATPLSYADLSPARLTDKWSDVGAKLGAQKARPWSELMSVDPKRVLGPVNPPAITCKACRRPVPVRDTFCSLCSDIIELGAKLTVSGYLSERRSAPRSGPIHRLDDLLARFGVSMHLEEMPTHECVNYVLNDYEAASRGADGFYFAPQLRAVKEFEGLAEASEGVKSWGVLRGDVDNLGLVFQDGLGKRVGLADLVSLSRSMNEFFGIYFNGILSQFKEQVYTVYAGGDDFFVVGSWSALPEIAATIRRDFSRYCANNPSLTLSAAMKIAPSTKFPVHRMADLVGDSLDDEAKKAEGKDAFAFLGAVFKWDQLEKARSVKDLVVRIVKGGGSKSITHTLFGAGDVEKQSRKAGESFKVWRVVYDVCRYRQRMSGDSAPLVDELLDAALPDQRTLYPFLKQSARWAELELRG